MHMFAQPQLNSKTVSRGKLMRSPRENCASENLSYGSQRAVIGLRTSKRISLKESPDTDLAYRSVTSVQHT